MITPISTSLLSYFVTQPLQRYFASNGIMDRSSHSIVRQKDLNDLQNGPEFDPTVNTAELLLLTFFSMTFAAGIPIMMPLACVTFVTYFFIHTHTYFYSCSCILIHTHTYLYVYILIKTYSYSNTRYDNMPQFLKSVKLLQGQFEDFDSGWYPIVGIHLP